MKLEPKTKKPITLVTRLEHKSSQTLVEFLAKRFPYHSSDEWREHIQEGKIKVNGLAPSENQPLRAGDEVAYTTNAWEEPAVNKNYRVVFEDEALLAVAKPAPLPVHAIGAYFQNTLMHLLRDDRPEAWHYYLVHRLDSETSGLLLLVKDPKYLKDLQKKWRTESVRKSYRAIVFGKFQPGIQAVDAPIGPKKGSKVRMKLAVIPDFEKGGIGGTLGLESLDGDRGKPSITEFSLLETKGNFSLIEARPLTGRTHQIRVHLEHLGYPIVGDKLYSGNDETFLHFYEYDWDDWLKERVLLPRVALHAFRLEFPHPVTGEKVLLEEPLPEDLTNFWNSL